MWICTAVMDLRTGILCILYRAAAPEVAAKSREMAEIAHVDYLVTSMYGTGGAYNYAGSMGIPSILLERGHSSRWCEDLVAEDVHDVKNILRHLRILRGSPIFMANHR